MCEFDPAILKLAGCFAHQLTQFIHCVNALYHLVHFWSVWYWLFLSMFSASFWSSCKAGLMVSKSLSRLFVKDFISPSLMKLSLAEYKILGWKLFFLRLLNMGPNSLLAHSISAERPAVSLMGFPLWVTDLSLWLPFAFVSSFQSWWIWQLCALGLLFLKNIFVMFSVFPGLEYWPALLGRGSSLDNILKSVFQLDSYSPSQSGTPIKCRLGLFT